MDSIRKVFAFRLKELRGAATQEAFAERLGIALRSYQKLEAGNVPQRKTLQTLVRALGLKSETALFVDPDIEITKPVPAEPTPRQALEALAGFLDQSELKPKSPLRIRAERALAAIDEPYLGLVVHDLEATAGIEPAQPMGNHEDPKPLHSNRKAKR